MTIASSPYLNRPVRSLSDLGPKQIEWLKANVPQFGPAKEAADRVKAHQAEVARQMPAPQEKQP